MSGSRGAAWLSGVWAGLLLAIGGVAAPVAFATTTREVAGAIAGRLFAVEAYAGLAIAITVFLMLRRRARAAAEAGRGSVFDADMLLVMSALFCTVLGHFALQPMMAPARAGQGPLSFGALHGLASGLYALKGLLVAVLAWRLAPR